MTALIDGKAPGGVLAVQGAREMPGGGGGGVATRRRREGERWFCAQRLSKRDGEGSQKTAPAG